MTVEIAASLFPSSSSHAAIALYTHQEDALSKMQHAYKRGAFSVLLVMPTGAGKTMIFSKAAALAAAKGRRVLLLAHRRELIGQISAALTRWNVAHGVIAAGRPETGHPVQVASIPTLTRRLYPGKYRFDLVVIDEAHHAVEGSGLGAILAELADAKRLGVTATPCRLDGKGLGLSTGGFFDTLVTGPSVLELIEQGYLAPPVVYAPPETVNLNAVKVRMGDYVIKELEAAMDKAPLTGHAVEHYARICPGQPALAFCVTVAHAEHVAEQFKAAGYSAAALSGDTPDELRDRMIRDLGQGRLQVLTSCNVVSEGTDIPVVSAAILLRPTASYSLAMQQMGRVLRVHPGKQKAIILDHAGNTRRHGLPTEPQLWTLTGRRKKEWKGGDAERERAKSCPGCFAVLAMATRTCPECGYEYRIEEVSPAASAEKLEAIDAVEVARQRRQEVAQAQSLEALKAIGKARGYKSGWAHHVWRERHIHSFDDGGWGARAHG
jgi:DNA repair protein RadD